MKGSDIISTVHNLKRAQQHMEAFMRDHRTSHIAGRFRNYATKVDWILTDMVSDPMLPGIVREGLRQEYKSDVFSTDAIIEQIPLLTPHMRELVETVIHRMLVGEDIELQLK